MDFRAITSEPLRNRPANTARSVGLVRCGKGWKSGDDGLRVVVPYVRSRGGDVAAMVISHSRTDHLGGVSTVVRSLDPEAVYDGAYLGGSAMYRASLDVMLREGVPWRRTRAGDSIVVDV